MAEYTDRLLCQLGVRGILTAQGVRKTVASGDLMLPLKQTLVESFCRPIVQLTEGTLLVSRADEKAKRKPIEKLTLGARALAKHAHRSSEVSSFP